MGSPYSPLEKYDGTDCIAALVPMKYVIRRIHSSLKANDAYDCTISDRTNS